MTKDVEFKGDPFQCIDPANLICTHPNSRLKNFTTKKAIEFCLTINMGEGCPFLSAVAVYEGRGNPVRNTRRSSRRFPGE